jgi:hypothetical protein
MGNLTQSANLNATIALLQRGITAVPLPEAMELITSWQEKLHGHDLAEDLGELKDLLASGNGTEAAIADILIDLGEDTAQLAEKASEADAAKAKQVADLLIQAGKSLK